MAKSKKKSSKRKKKRAIAQALVDEVAQMRMDLIALVQAMQAQNQGMAGQGGVDQSGQDQRFAGMTDDQIMNVTQGFAPNWAGAPPAQEQPKPEAPLDPTKITVDVPQTGDLTTGTVSGENLTALQEACGGNPKSKNSVLTDMTNSEVRSQYNMSTMLYVPSTNKFYRTYCDAFNSGAGPNGIYFVDEGLLQSRLRNAGETGPYTADELASGVTSTQSADAADSTASCMTNINAAPRCPPGFQAAGKGRCYESAADITYTSYQTENPFQDTNPDDPEGDPIWYKDMCPYQNLENVTQGDGSSASQPRFRFPVSQGGVLLWSKGKGLKGNVTSVN